MHAIFTAKQGEIACKRENVESLERKLLLDSVDKEDSLRDATDHLSNDTLKLLCTLMIHIHPTIQKEKHEIAQLAGMVSRFHSDFTNSFAVVPRGI